MIAFTRRAFTLTAAASLASVALRASARRNSRVIQLGGTAVRLTTIEESRGLTFFHPHENEHASSAVARAFVRQHGGRLLEVQSRGARLISFALNGVGYSFEPDRIFTDLGLERNLSRYGHYSSTARDAVKPLRNAVLGYLKRSGGPIVGVESNNVDGVNIGYYQGNAQFAQEAAKVARNRRAHKHDFFLVQDEKLFSELQHEGFNVVLQTPTPTDNGSLSVYCRQNGLRYVNVQAAEDRTDEQARMIEALHKLLK